MERKNKLTKEQNLLCSRLCDMKLSGMAEAFEAQVTNPNSDLMCFFDRFEMIVNHEWELRFNKKFSRFLKQAALRYPQADIDETIYHSDRLLDTAVIERLCTCSWIEEGRNLLITGSTGAGKSYLSNALCISALRQFKSARYIRANTLLNELEQARLKSSYLEYIKQISCLELLIIDDFGLMDLDLDKCRDLFEIVDCRDGRKSTMIVSQIPVCAWYDLFADRTYAEASLDRLVHNAYRLELNGRNMRKYS